MYFVDRNKITDTLTHLDELLAIFEGNDNWLVDDITKLALQRIGHNAIEAMMDVGNLIIDGFIMRDPGSYEDIIDIFVDEKVITNEMEIPLKNIIALRKMIVREFIAVDNEQIIETLKANLSAVKQFSECVTTYLENELGPVSAFLPENK